VLTVRPFEMAAAPLPGTAAGAVGTGVLRSDVGGAAASASDTRTAGEGSLLSRHRPKLPKTTAATPAAAMAQGQREVARRLPKTSAAARRTSAPSTRVRSSV